jgi:uncharacterized protein involved in exopolysaccharide biosynthesis
MMTAFFRQGGTFLSVLAIVLSIGLTWLFITDPVYEASGSLVIKFGKNSFQEASMSEETPYPDADAGARQEVIRSFIKIILSKDLLRELVNEYGVYRLYPKLQQKIDDDIPADEVAVENLLEEDLEAVYDGTHIIDVRVRNQSPLAAAHFAGTVMKAFIRRQTEIYNTPQTDFLKGQIEEARQRLKKSQQAMQSFKQESGVSDIDEEMAQLLKEKSELGTLAFTAVSEAQTRLAELKTREAEMQSTYRASSPILIRMRKTVEVAREDLARRQRDLDTASSGSSLARKMRKVNNRITYLESQRVRFNELQQKLQIDENNYLYYVKRGEEARINNLLNRQNITRIAIVDQAAVPVEPEKPKVILWVSITLLAALMAAIGAALVRELLDDRLSNPEQVYSSLGVPVLASFEKEKT